MLPALCDDAACERVSRPMSLLRTNADLYQISETVTLEWVAKRVEPRRVCRRRWVASHAAIS